MPRLPATAQRVNTHLNELCEKFEHYLEVFENENPFNKGVYKGGKDVYIKVID